jgi:hypothetical protein
MRSEERRVPAARDRDSMDGIYFLLAIIYLYDEQRLQPPDFLTEVPRHALRRPGSIKSEPARRS